MLKKLLAATALLVGLGMTMPLGATSAWKYAGHITALDGTSITIFDKDSGEHVKVAYDDNTSISHWIREKPYVRTMEYLTPSALKFGGLVRVSLRDAERVADAIEVASDVKAAFAGHVKSFDATSLSVYDEDMDVVTLAYGNDTRFVELFTVKPWIRPDVRLSANDLKAGAYVIMYSSKPGASTTDRVEIARSK